MTFGEAVALAHMIRGEEGWYLLSIEPLYGSRLEEDQFEVTAVCRWQWRKIHRWKDMATQREWDQFSEIVRAAGEIEAKREGEGA